MLSNHQYFLSNTREECCKKFYEWNYYSCTGTRPKLNGEFYPDWSGKSTTSACLNDNKMPEYMIQNQAWYLSKTRSECCKRHFNWDFNNCMGTTNAGTRKWYAKYDATTCVQDCVGASPCGGVAESWDELYQDKTTCCKQKMWYDNKCMGTTTVAVGTNKWYVKYDSMTCVKDCVGASPCGGVAQSWDELFVDKTTCCNKKMWYDPTCYRK